MKSRLSSVPMLAISAADDDEAKALAETYGALALLDKMRLYDELVPAILQYAPREFHPTSDLRLPKSNSSESDSAQ